MFYITRINSKKARTLFMAVEQDALGFEDENDVFWVGAVHDSGRLCAEELVGFVNFFKHILKKRHKKLFKSNP